MSEPGRITKDRLGYTMPVTAPLFGRPPVHYRARETLVVRYETDPDAALEVLPSCLELPGKAMATIGIQEIVDSSLGTYREAFLAVDALWRGEAKRYLIVLALTSNDAALVWGREVSGAPKTTGVVAFNKLPEGVLGYVERPAGERLATVEFRRDEWVDPATLTIQPAPFVCLRVQINPEGVEPRVHAELIETPSDVQLLEYWRGSAQLAVAQTGPWGSLPLEQIEDAWLMQTHATLGWPKLLERF